MEYSKAVRWAASKVEPLVVPMVAKRDETLAVDSAVYWVVLKAAESVASRAEMRVASRAAMRAALKAAKWGGQPVVLTAGPTAVASVAS